VERTAFVGGNSNKHNYGWRAPPDRRCRGVNAARYALPPQGSSANQQPVVDTPVSWRLP